MEKLILADNTEIQILDGASLGNISAEVENWAAAGNVITKLTDENLKKVQFVSGEDVSGEYTDMTLITPVQVTPGSPTVLTFGIRERTEEEIQQEDVQTAIEYLTDEQALTVKNLYPEYDPNGKEYKTGNRAVQDGVLYKCLQDHTSQPDWAPGLAPSLWVALNSGEHAGTQEDPIPVPDTVTTAGMEYEYGKYYLENGTVYLCKRGGVENPEEMYGQKETLYFAPSALVGQYFEAVE